MPNKLNLYNPLPTPGFTGRELDKTIFNKVLDFQ